MLPWWGALLVGVAAFLLVSVGLNGYIESQLLAAQGNQFYPVLEARLGRLSRVCDWVGMAVLLVGIFFAVRNFYVRNRARSTEKSIVTAIAKLLGRSID